jgi:hypothetical protein
MTIYSLSTIFIRDGSELGKMQIEQIPTHKDTRNIRGLFVWNSYEILDLSKVKEKQEPQRLVG